MKTAAEFGYPEVEKQAKAPLKDTAAVNGSMQHDGEFGVVLKLPDCLSRSVLVVGPNIIDRFVTCPKCIGWMQSVLVKQRQRR